MAIKRKSIHARKSTATHLSTKRTVSSGGGSESLVDNFEFQLIGGEDVPFAGYVSSGDPTILSPQVMIAGSRNAYKSLSGGISNRPGLKKRGAADNTQAGTISAFEWESSLGFTRPVRQNNGQLQVEFDAGDGNGLLWHEIMSGLPSTVCSYCPWYDPNAQKDYLLMVNGQQQINAWQGGVGLISAAANTTGIIGGILNPNNTVNAGTGSWCSGGTGYVVGDQITVTGGNGDAILIVDAIGSGGIATVSVGNSGGSGYVVGDLVKVNYPSGGPITNVTVAAGGNGYLVGDTVTIGSGGAIFTVTAVSSFGTVSGLSITAGGSGYSGASSQGTSNLSSSGAGLTVTYSVSSGIAILKVTSVSGGVVTGLSIVASGTAYAVSSSQTTTTVFTTGSGSGLTVTIGSIGTPITAWHFKNNGSGYPLTTTYAPLATTGGTGTLASVYVETILTGRVTFAGIDTAPELGFAGALSPTSSAGLIFSGGTFLVDGVSWAYTCLGDNGQSFIGFGSDPSALNAKVAVSAVTVTDTSPDSTTTAAQLEENFTNDALAVVNNQVHIICYSSRVVHVSSSLHYDHYDIAQLAGGALRTPGFPDILYLDSNGRAVGTQKGSAVIFGSLGDSYLVTRKAANYNQGTNYALLAYEDVTVAKEKSSDLSSPKGQDFLDYIGDIIIFLDDNNQLREYGTVRNINTPVYPILSIDLYDELAGIDFTGGHLRTVGEQSGETVYITAPKVGDTYVYQVRQDFDAVGNITSERLWQPPLGWNISRVAVIDGVSYGHSYGTPMLYQLWDTDQWEDDSPSGDALPYTATALFAYQCGGRRQGKTVFDKVYYEGYTTEGTTLTGIVNLEYLGSLDILSPIISSPGSPATFFGISGDGSLGQNSLGDQPNGDETENQDPNNNDQTRVKFRTICGVEEANVFEFALGVTSQNAGDRWELLFIGPNAMLSSTDQASELVK